MASSSKLRGAQDRISGLPDSILCHILSFLRCTREAAMTSVLSHRWNNVWISMPNLDLNESCFTTQDFTEFVDRVLLFRGGADIHRFSLTIYHYTPYRVIESSRFDAWISTVIRRNVVEIELDVIQKNYQIPKRLFMCNTLVSLSLWLGKEVIVNTPSSNFFPCLKRLHVTVHYPSSDSMEKLFSCCPALEDLVIDGIVDDSSSYDFCITALKLKRLKITFGVGQFSLRNDDFEYSVCLILINADVPNLEELEMYPDILVSYSLKNAICLREAKLKLFDMDELLDLNRINGLSDRISQLFAGICSAKYLTVSYPRVVALDIGSPLLLPTFNNLKHLELQLETCRCLQSLPTYLKISPNLEHLKISTSLKFRNDEFCDNEKEDEVVCKWGSPDSVPICLTLHLKTICLWEFKCCPNELEVIKYLLQHGKALNEVTIHNHFNAEMELQSPIYLWSKCSEFPRGSKTCKIVFRTIID